ncbi:MAG: glycosyltransferase family 2 protein [Gammaproteobacteria bacterium]
MSVEDGFSVVIPVYNEADAIAELLTEIFVKLDSCKVFEVVVVDDGSDDSTPQVLLHAQHQYGTRLRIIRHQQRSGQSAALRTAVSAAHHKWIVMLDGDGQNDPADVPNLLAARIEPGSGAARLVCGHRRRRRDSWVKRLSSRVANHVRSRLLGDGVLDTGCGLKAFTRDAFLRLPWFDHMHRFLPALMHRDGVPVVSVDVNHRPRTRGTSKYGVGNRLWVGIVDMLGVLWLQRRGKRIVANEVNESNPRS